MIGRTNAALLTGVRPTPLRQPLPHPIAFLFGDRRRHRRLLTRCAPPALRLGLYHHQRQYCILHTNARHRIRVRPGVTWVFLVREYGTVRRRCLVMCVSPYLVLRPPSVTSRRAVPRGATACHAASSASSSRAPTTRARGSETRRRIVRTSRGLGGVGTPSLSLGRARCAA